MRSQSCSLRAQSHWRSYLDHGSSRRCRPSSRTSSLEQSLLAVEHIKIHGTSLEGNLEGDAVDRDVIVFLPPSYQKDKKRRYPVVYALHGYSIGAEQWSHEIHVPQTIEGAFALGSQEMIVVLPDSKTIYNGSMYSSSATTGDFEKFISKRRCVLHRRALSHHPRLAPAAVLSATPWVAMARRASA